jgi:hypothetical protein
LESLPGEQIALWRTLAVIAAIAMPHEEGAVEERQVALYRINAINACHGGMLFCVQLDVVVLRVDNMAGVRYAGEVLPFRSLGVKVIWIKVVPLDVATPGLPVIAGVQFARRDETGQISTGPSPIFSSSS